MGLFDEIRKNLEEALREAQARQQGRPAAPGTDPPMRPTAPDRPPPVDEPDREAAPAREPEWDDARRSAATAGIAPAHPDVVHRRPEPVPATLRQPSRVDPTPPRRQRTVPVASPRISGEPAPGHFARLHNHQDLRDAIVLCEILGPPRARRRRRT
jgi:hypothetical protein